MKYPIALVSIALAGCIGAPSAQQEARPVSGAPMAHAKPAAMPPDVETHPLAALEAMTFDCPKAGLDAAARAAAKVPSQGSYQFSYFRLVSDAHHAMYEIHFKSNAASEPELRYCVSMYCQQGWDPRTTQVDVRLMSDARQPGVEGGGACGAPTGSKKKGLR
jgi:hypothetical protein